MVKALKEIKTKIKRIVPTCALAAIVLAYPGSVLAAGTNVSDIELSSDYAREAILALAEEGVISGDEKGSFKPQNAVIRAEMVKMIVNSMGIDTGNVPQTPTFSDVPREHWAYGFIEAAYREGIVKGVAPGVFGIDGKCTREQMAAMYVRSLGLTDEVVNGQQKLENVDSFKDGHEISWWAKGYVDLIVSSGLMKGTGDSLFSPWQIALRQDAAVLTHRFISNRQAMNEFAESTMGIHAGSREYPDLYKALESNVLYRGEYVKRVRINIDDNITGENMLMTMDVSGAVNQDNTKSETDLTLGGSTIPSSKIRIESVKTGENVYVKNAETGEWEMTTLEELELQGAPVVTSETIREVSARLMENYGSIHVVTDGYRVVEGQVAVKYTMVIDREVFIEIFPAQYFDESVDINQVYNNGFDFEIEVYLNNSGQIIKELARFTGGVKTGETDMGIEVTEETIYRNIGAEIIIEAPM